MGTWADDDLFGNDLACDVRDAYLEQLSKGLKPQPAVMNVLDAHPDQDEDERAVFWIALAAIQLEQGEALPMVKKAALRSIAYSQDSERGLDASPYSLETLDALRLRLGGSATATKPLKKKTPAGDVGDVLRVTLPDGEGDAVVVVVRRGSRNETERTILYLKDLPADGLDETKLIQALLAWRPYVYRWHDGQLGRTFCVYDTDGKVPRSKALFRVDMPEAVKARLSETYAYHPPKDIPYVMRNESFEWTLGTWILDPERGQD